MLGGSSIEAYATGSKVSSVKKVFALSYWVLVVMHIKFTSGAQDLRQKLLLVWAVMGSDGQ